ncbi:methionine--tRNA ligase [Oerskovia paurometabola]|uniref:methionine--tRNA ligase n=1 Tax=Oerskovia paurometabola TaxID=162170 RepID=A0ABW1X6X2_9CELL|nr:methionine--tRNA ligase [Oerskovia paurometabola]MBM7498118.1 methionyl-tRNA synthetase [Oerskovia paurometabola]
MTAQTSPAGTPARPTFYVTTAIPYVNGDPHLGHALELVQTDVLARHARLRGRPTRFLTGTDDHALKNVSAARAAGREVGAFVAEHVEDFRALRPALSLSTDDFLSTSTDPRHRPGVEALWRRCAEAGDFYRRSYEGLYCAGCEQFYSPDELDASGRCPEHLPLPERVVEENWFFRLSRHTDAICEVITSGRVRINPAAKRNEVLAFLDAGLEDFSVSRPATRSDGWGIPVPGDPSQVVYVWWDALTNYVTALGYGAGPAAPGAADDYRTWWSGGDERVHVIGKGITRFHAVYWLGLLLSAGEPLPTTIHVHDYVTAGGAKLAKSAGTAVHPVGLVDAFGTDALRWWFAREVPLLGDAEFTTERLVARHDDELAHGVGNLVNRTLTLVHRFRGGAVPAIPRARATDPDELSAAVGQVGTAVDAALADADLRAATGAVRRVVDAANRYVNAEKPWELAARERTGNQDAGGRLDQVLARLVEACRVVAVELSPFVPDGAARLREQLGSPQVAEASGPDRVGHPTPVFPRLGTDR